MSFSVNRAEAAPSPSPGQAPKGPAGKPPARRRRWPSVTLAVVTCLVAGVVIQQSAVILAADWESSIARTRMMKWAAGKEAWDDAQWERARIDLERALQLTPRDATLHDAMAQLYSIRANAVWTTGEPGTPEMALYGKAREHQEASLRIRPLHANAWANLAMVHYALNSPPEQLYHAWRQALKIGPQEPEVQQTLLTVAADTWEVAPQDVRQWAEQRKPGFGAEMERRIAQAEAEDAAALAAAQAAQAASAGSAASVAPATASTAAR